MFAVYGLRTLVYEVTVLSVYVCLYVCVSECVASKALEGYVTKSRDTQWNFHLLAAANLSLGRSRQLTFWTPNMFRMLVTKRQKKRRWNDKKKNAICCSLCMCCQTIMLQPGAQFSCYTQIYQVLLMCVKNWSDVRWNFLTRLTKKTTMKLCKTQTKGGNISSHPGASWFKRIIIIVLKTVYNLRYIEIPN